MKTGVRTWVLSLAKKFFFFALHRSSVFTLLFMFADSVLHGARFMFGRIKKKKKNCTHTREYICTVNRSHMETKVENFFCERNN